MLNRFTIIFSIILLISCEQQMDDAWTRFAKETGFGGYHKENSTDHLKAIGLCSDQAVAYDCNNILFWLLELNSVISQLTNQTDIQIKNSSSYSRITFTFKDQVVVLNASEISKIITVPFDPAGLYKIETSSGTVFENSSFNFRGSLKDGTIITTDGTLINDLDLAGCNLINVETGKIETVSGQCLTPTNP